MCASLFSCLRGIVFGSLNLLKMSRTSAALPDRIDRRRMRRRHLLLSNLLTCLLDFLLYRYIPVTLGIVAES